MEELKVDFNVKDKKLLIKIKGDIDLLSSDKFYNNMKNEINKTDGDIIFDLENVKFLDSTALGVFVKLNKDAKELQRKLTLINVKPNIKKLFVICTLDKVIEIK